MKKLLFIFLITIGISASAQHTEKENYIKKESIAGKLDFSKKVEAKYGDAPSIRFGDLLYNKKDFAILLWAANVRNFGVQSFEHAAEIWEEIYKRSLTDLKKKL
ncbi:hypothetical protein [Chryseobacterium chendengshani]|uniref:hypothetical protein n=1 Tax=Chryseobacterium sp. LJ756 TaxID=2864113 RepID=UPI001C6410DA|nr:hypothetical protein [Chryseobacterium sp. LJ756]MBW7674479.1 hypothetical protein [Chryseobacterium sp. LJ756]